MSRLGDRFPEADLPHVRLGTSPTPVRRLDGLGISQEVWLKDESVFGDGGWGGNKVRKLEWIIPEAHRRGRSTMFTVGGIGTHWGLAAALYGREHGLHTVLGLVAQPIDDHVREQTARLDASGATIYRYPSVARLKLAAPLILARHQSRGRLPYYLPAGGSSPVGSLGYVEVALEIAEQVAAGELPEPATIVVAVGSGGTTAGLALGLRLAGLSTRVFGAVVNDSLRLDDVTTSRLATKTADLLRSRGANIGDIVIGPDDLTTTSSWMGETYGATTPEGADALALADRVAGLELEPVYTAKALAAILDGKIDGPVLFLNTHGPRPVA
ncbi:MAG: pyridoxal-phosphate dependent enzyme [Aeromicrobium sp.]